MCKLDSFEGFPFSYWKLVSLVLNGINWIIFLILFIEFVDKWFQSIYPDGSTFPKHQRIFLSMLSAFFCIYLGYPILVTLTFFLACKYHQWVLLALLIYWKKYLLMKLFPDTKVGTDTSGMPDNDMPRSSLEDMYFSQNSAFSPFMTENQQRDVINLPFDTEGPSDAFHESDDDTSVAAAMPERQKRVAKKRHKRTDVEWTRNKKHKRLVRVRADDAVNDQNVADNDESQLDIRDVSGS